MIKEIIMYTVICDGCGVDVNEDSEVVYNDKIIVEEIAMDYDWLKKGRKHYCPDCFSYDDNDNLVLKNIKQ